MRYVAFLRGMNVGGHRITNEQLCDCLAASGCENPWAFLASGNVVFDSAARSRSTLSKRLEKGLEAKLGYAVPTFLRTAKQVIEIAEADPFAQSARKLNGKPQVALLGSEPTAAQRRKALAFATNEDRLEIVGEELHWEPSGKLLDSTLDLAGIASILGPMTVRTRNTLQRLAKRLTN